MDKTIVDILHEIAEDFCYNFCKYADECESRNTTGEKLRECPIEKLV